MHDAPIAHAGALGGEPGVVVIAGTGSVVYGCDERGGAQTLGGWGFLFGDEGSAFRIAAGALALMMRAEDDGDPALWEAARAAGEFFEAGSLRQIARAFYAGTIARERLAAFAPAAMRFEPFRALAYCGADRLAALARRALAPMRSKNVALSGGLFADAGFYERVSGAILTAVPGAQIRRAKYDPAAGALLLAYRECEMPIAELSP
jgi:N-acetylglucosamine kinase-like BadF-type ATPase